MIRALAFLAACSHAAPVPVAPRAPSPGVAPHYYPARWNQPALLCNNGPGSRLVWAGQWRCL